MKSLSEENWEYHAVLGIVDIRFVEYLFLGIHHVVGDFFLFARLMDTSMTLLLLCFTKAQQWPLYGRWYLASCERWLRKCWHIIALTSTQLSDGVMVPRLLSACPLHLDFQSHRRGMCWEIVHTPPVLHYRTLSSMVGLFHHFRDYGSLHYMY